MKSEEGSIGRIFILRLEDGDRMPDVLEEFAADKGVKGGMAILVGGIGHGGEVVVGPRDAETMPPEPMLRRLQGVHEVLGVGTLFPDDEGRPSLHMHAALGRKDHTVTGCIRPGIQAWQIAEVVLLEITGIGAARLPDAVTGFSLLTCTGD
jgi:predicted DNA-binding protein with PD1-like motif